MPKWSKCVYVCFAFHHYISTGFLVRSNLLCSLWVYYYTLFLDVPSRFLTCFLFRKIFSKAEKVVFAIIECESKPYITDSYLVLFIWVKKVMTIVVWKVQFFCHIRYSHKLVYMLFKFWECIREFVQTTGSLFSLYDCHYHANGLILSSTTMIWIFPLHNFIHYWYLLIILFSYYFKRLSD